MAVRVWRRIGVERVEERKGEERTERRRAVVAVRYDIVSRRG
jgi:hypothetical protein